MSSPQPHPSWRADTLLARVLKNSGYLFSSTSVSAVLGFAQGILVVRLIGIENYGLLVGTIFVFVTNVNRLLSFRMSEVTVKYLGEALAQNDKGRVAALVKGIGLIEAATSILAYLVLFALTPWAARTFAGDPSTASLFRVYGVFLLGNLVYETSTGVLQTFKRFDRIAAVNLIQSVLTFLLIGAAFLWHGNLTHILAAYLLGKLLAGLLITLFALRELASNLGPNWWRHSSFILHPSSLSFALSTNLNGTLTLLVRDSAPLFLALFASQTEVGYFKLALSLVNMVTLPIEPFIWPTYAELTETVALAKWDATKRLLRRVSAIAAAWTLSAGGILAAIGWWLIPFLYGADSAPAYPATVILLLGFGFATILHWNRPLLLAFGKPSFPLLASALVGAVEIILIFLLVSSTGYLGMSWLMSGYLIVSIGVIVWRGLAEIKQRSA
ncbi:MAG: oligosaccharide flippase family protein [Chloroflexota bacterium]